MMTPLRLSSTLWLSLAAAGPLLGQGTSASPSPNPAASPAIAATPSPASPSVALPLPPVTSPEYLVGPGDVLEVTVIGNPDLSRTATVQPSGSIGLPLLNEVPVAGSTLAQVQERLTTLLGKDFLVNPQVEVRVKEYHSQFALVVGEVNSPGRKALRGSTRLIDLLVEAGGFTPRASGDVLIARAQGSFEDGTKTLRMRLTRGQFSVSEYLSLELPIRTGDVVTALQRSYVTVEGEVQRPGRFPIEGDLTLTGALSLAGGLTRFGSSKVQLQRFDKASGKQSTLKVDLKAVRKGSKPDIPLEDNDRITVPRRLF
jgi:polysaccharide biosynthesis/export protein